MPYDDLDPYPVGTVTPTGGIGPDDPLIDWASNLKPSDLQRFVHDPEGFKQDMINRGIPPPAHDYIHDGQKLQPVYNQNQPVRMNQQGGIQGNMSDYISGPTPAEDAAAAAAAAARKIVAPPAGPAAPPGAARGYSDPVTGAEVPGTPSNEAIKPKSWSEIGNQLIPPESPIRQHYRNRPAAPPPAAAAESPFVPHQPTPEERVRVDKPPVREAPRVPEQEIAPAAAAGTPAERKAEEAVAKAATEKKKVDPYSAEAISDFARSMQGVQMPKPPQLPGVGTPGVRSPVGVQPGIATLLALAGQGRPGGMASLMHLLGRA
jgi:hypothetical protein